MCATSPSTGTGRHISLFTLNVKQPRLLWLIAVVVAVVACVVAAAENACQ